MWAEATFRKTGEVWKEAVSKADSLQKLVHSIKSVTVWQSVFGIGCESMFIRVGDEPAEKGVLKMQGCLPWHRA